MTNPDSMLPTTTRGEVRILVVEDTMDHAELISVMLRREDSRIRIAVAQNVNETIGSIDSFNPDIILTDYRLGRESCFDVLFALQQKSIEIPVVILTGQGDEKVAADAITRGAYDYLIKDQVFQHTATLTKSIYAVLQRFQLQKALQENEELYRTLVQNMMDGVFILKNGDLVFSNPAFAEISRVREEEIKDKPLESLFTKESRQRIHSAIADVLQGSRSHRGRFVLHGNVDSPEIYIDLTLNSVIYAGERAVIGTAKDVTAQVIAEREMSRMLAEKQQLSVTDDLTNLSNRRHAITSLENEIQRSKRYGNKLSVIMFDLDNFKSINDTYGHLMGDKALQRVARVLQAEMRETDIAARYGGDEFLMILPHTGFDQATAMAERIRAAMEETKFPENADYHIDLTPSMGVTELLETDDKADAMIARADKGLMQAKKSGKNTVVSI